MNYWLISQYRSINIILKYKKMKKIKNSNCKMDTGISEVSEGFVNKV